MNTYTLQNILSYFDIDTKLLYKRTNSLLKDMIKISRNDYYCDCEQDGVHTIDYMAHHADPFGNIMTHGIEIKSFKLLNTNRLVDAYYSYTILFSACRSCKNDGFSELYRDIAKYAISKLLNNGDGDCDYSSALYNACQGGNMELIKFIMGMGTSNWNSGLEGACECGHMDVLKLMIDKGADDWDNGLEFAGQGGNLDMVKFMIENGNSATMHWDNCFRNACHFGHFHIVKFLLEKYGNKLCAHYLDNGLACACGGNHMDIVKFMISIGAKNWNDGLKSACRHGNLDIVKFMVESGANNFNEGFIYACREGRIETIEFLIANCAIDLNKGLYYAYKYKQLDAIRLLIAKGAKMNKNVKKYLKKHKNT